MTALTVNGSAVAATTLVAAGKLFNATGGTSGNTSTKVGTGTQFKQIFAKGTATNQTGVASIPAPTDANFNGWMWDVTTLEGQRLASGTITPTFHLLASTGTTITPTVEWYKRSSGGVYTQIATVAGSSIALTTSAQALTFTPPTGTQTDFATGDKLCMWLWVNQTAGGATNSTISVVEATSGSSAGVVSEAQAVTPGYTPTPLALAVTMAGVGTLSGTFSSVISYVIIASDTFVRANQSAWGTASDGQTWATGRAAPVWSIASNEGLLAASSGGTFTIVLLGSKTVTDQEVLARVQPANTTSNIGLVARFVNTNNFYYGVLVGGTVAIGKSVVGVFSTIASASFSYSTSNFYQVRLRTDGSTLQLKIWQDGTSEPSAWTVSTTDSALASGGFGLASDASVASSFDSLTVSNGVQALTGECDGIGTLAATMDATTALSATLVGAGTLTGTLALSTALSTSLAGVGQLSGTLSANTALADTFTGAGTLSGTLSTSSGGVALSVTIAGVGTLSETLSATTSLTDTLAGVGTLTETLTVTTSLASIIAGIGTLTGTSSLSTALSVTFVGIGTLTETLSAKTPLTSTLAGVGTLNGTLSASNSAALSVTLAGVGQLSGTPALNTALAASMAGAGSLTGTLALTTPLSTSMAGSGHLSATISEQTALSTSMAGTGILASTLMLTTSLASSLAGVGQLSGVFSVHVALSLTFMGLSRLVGTLTTSAPGTPGTATVLDQFVAFALLGDGLVSMAGISDRLVSASSTNDTSLATPVMSEQPLANAVLMDKLG